MVEIGGIRLDNEQEQIVYDESDNLLVVAGAGSGKTLTILGKIKYLINEKNIIQVYEMYILLHLYPYF